MNIYRLEHIDSGLGPFMHINSDDTDVELRQQLGFHIDHGRGFAGMANSLFIKNKMWGWYSMMDFNRFCNPELLKEFNKIGFILKIYNLEESQCRVFADGQVAFNKI